MHPARITVLGGTGFAVISMLLPFASFPIVGAVDGVSADAWPALLPLVLVVILTLRGRWDHGLEPIAGVTAVVAASASLVFALVKVADALVAVRETPGATMGPGAFVLSAATAVTVAGTAAAALART